MAGERRDKFLLAASEGLAATASAYAAQSPLLTAARRAARHATGEAARIAELEHQAANWEYNVTVKRVSSFLVESRQLRDA